MSLTDFVFANTSWFEADLIKITLPNGSVLTTTNHQLDLVGPDGLTYYAMKYGKWERGPVTFERNTVNETDLTMNADKSILFPNSVATPMFQRSKLFARSTVQIITAILSLDAPQTIVGYTIVFTGLITIPTVESAKVTFKCSDHLYRTQEPWPRRVICAGCPFAVFDRNCALDKNAFAVTRTVAAGSTQTNLALSSALSAVGNDSLPFSKGYIVPTTGEAQGWSITITQQTDTTHVSLAPFDLPIKVGDSITLFPGCDGKLTTCAGKFSNASHFGGFPVVPGPPAAISGTGS
jgi:uncharacterized phage protein (TIGR02218 family)